MIIQSTGVIIYPLDYLPVANAAQMKILDAFTADLTRTSEFQIQKISIADESGIANRRKKQMENLYMTFLRTSAPLAIFTIFIQAHCVE